MFLEFDWTSNTFRSHLGEGFTEKPHAFETLAAARHDLRLIGLRLGAKTDGRTWRVEFQEPIAAAPDVFRLEGWANRFRPLKPKRRTLGGQLHLKADNVKLRHAIEKALKTADPATREKVAEIGQSQWHDADEKDVNDILKRRNQALIDADVWSDAS
jgi:hypothetical protein